MVELTNKNILKEISRAKKVEFEPQFSLEDLVGKMIHEHRRIKNPRKNNPKVESPNPEYFDALIFSDRTFLVTENFGDGECGHLHYYFYNGHKTLYSDQLFGIL